MHVDPEGRVTVPEFLVEFLGWAAGDAITYEVHEDLSITLRRQED